MLQVIQIDDAWLIEVLCLWELLRESIDWFLFSFGWWQEAPHYYKAKNLRDAYTMKMPKN